MRNTCYEYPQKLRSDLCSEIKENKKRVKVKVSQGRLK